MFDADLHASAIRKEQKERSEILRTWLTVVLSLIGAVCGVAALLFRK
jgi:cell division protein FtsB